MPVLGTRDVMEQGHGGEALDAGPAHERLASLSIYALEAISVARIDGGSAPHCTVVSSHGSFPVATSDRFHGMTMYRNSQSKAQGQKTVGCRGPK